MGNVPGDEDHEHFHKVIGAFKSYRANSLQRLGRTEQYLSTLPLHHQRMLQKYQQNLAWIKTCIETNNDVIKLIIKDVFTIFGNALPVRRPKSPPDPVTSDFEKVQATLKQFVRDWSEEGAAERKACYQPIINEITAHFSRRDCPRQDIKVLVPGAGLGRLTHEIARRGFSCQGNEFSLFMLCASNFVLNKCKKINQYRIHPWIHQTVNNMCTEDRTQSVSFPDIDPSGIPSHTNLSMAAGDFLEIYTVADEWDCVATCFFIDCASNIIAFIEAIYKILKPGGIWVNLGPLLYHFADLPDENSIEPSYDDIRDVMEGIGFKILKEKLRVKTTYAQNPSSMLQYQYNSVFFVCQKPSEDQTGARKRSGVNSVPNGTDDVMDT